MDCGWLGPRSSILRLIMPNNDFERFYRDYIGNHGRVGDVTISVRMLEGEAPIVLENGYVSECKGTQVLVVADLSLGAREQFEHGNFRDYVISEDSRREEIQRAEEKKPHLQRFRIAMEED